MKNKLLVIVIITLLVSSCSANNNDNIKDKSEVIDNEFKLTIFSDKEVFATDEIINIHADFEYLGNEKVIHIWHASSYCRLSIKDDSDEYIYYENFDDVLKTTEIASNTIYEFNYNPRVDNFKKLPCGDYTAVAEVDFSTDENLNEKINFTAEVPFKVK